MTKRNAVAIKDSKVTLFARKRTALAEVGIDLESIIETYKYFTTMQAEDPELKIPTYRAKIPSSGGRVFDIITGDEEFDTSVTSFRGVVVNYHNCNALYLNPEPSNEPPDCSSPDGIKGLDMLNGEIKDCESCPSNQWGSGNGTKRGKACKNMRRLYILVEGSDIPIVMTLPPTSIVGWEKYKSAVLGVRRQTPKEVVTEFSLGAAINGAGIKYSVVQFKPIGVIGNAVQETIKQLGNGESYDNEIEANDYNTVLADEALSEKIK